MGIRRRDEHRSQGGEADVKNDKYHHATVSHTRHADRTLRSWARPDWRALLVSLAAAVSLAATPGMPGLTGTAMAQSMIHVGATKRTASVVVAVGKSEDVRTDQP